MITGLEKGRLAPMLEYSFQILISISLLISLMNGTVFIELAESGGLVERFRSLSTNDDLEAL